MKIILPEKVKFILEQLEIHGFEGYAVGGCIRDSVLGRTPSDWDITTSATPREVKEIFPKTFDTGIEHGTITVLLDKEGFEVTTYRIDGEYEDCRHPRQVQFTPNLIEDLKRRDFTINAMAYNESRGLVDAFGGIGDLQNRVVRCVGNAWERFGEDALRMMRAVRFCAQLGFRMDSETSMAIRELAPSLKKISAERIRTELVKLLESPHPDWIRQAWEDGITKVILPEFDSMMEQPQNSSHHIYSVGEHTLEALRNVRADRILRLSVLFHDMGKPEVAAMDERGIYHFRGHAGHSAEIAKKIMKRLKFDNDTLQKVYRLVLHHSLYPEMTPEGVRRAVYLLGEELFPFYMEIKRADILGQNPAVQEKKLGYLEEIERIYGEIIARGDCLSLKTLAVTGKDLIGDGVKPGKGMGELLDRLLDEVLEVPERNTREWLLERSRQLRKMVADAPEL